MKNHLTTKGKYLTLAIATSLLITLALVLTLHPAIQKPVEINNGDSMTVKVLTPAEAKQLGQAGVHIGPVKDPAVYGANLAGLSEQSTEKTNNGKSANQPTNGDNRAI